MLLSNYVFWFLRSELESLNVVVLNVDEFESSDASSRSANDKPLLGRALKKQWLIVVITNKIGSSRFSKYRAQTAIHVQ